MATKKIAIIGAGIFGISAALELSKKHKVTVFDAENDIFSKATFANQHRHHIGYHYPRSLETVLECKKSKKDFETVYKKAIVANFPCYYAVSKYNSKTSAKKYLEFCRQQNLPFKINYPKKDFIDRTAVAMCIKVPESVYDFKTLKEITLSQIKNTRNLTLKLETAVVDGFIGKNGIKVTLQNSNGSKTSNKFDYVINATYSNYNFICNIFGLTQKDIQYELVELLVVKLPIEIKIGLTIMDGPFTCVLPMGNSGYHTLGHVDTSVHKRVVIKDKQEFKGFLKIKTKKDLIVGNSIKFFPVLKNAKYIESLFVTRVVNPVNEIDDGRPTELKNHGFGFFSIFGGKIITCTTTAKSLAKAIN